MPTTPTHGVRISHELWEAAGEKAKEMGLTRPEFVRIAIGLMIVLETVEEQKEPIQREDL